MDEKVIEESPYIVRNTNGVGVSNVDISAYDAAKRAKQIRLDEINRIENMENKINSIEDSLNKIISILEDKWLRV